jgi:hypothetical protein
MFVWPTPGMGRPPFLHGKFAGTSVQIVVMKGPLGLSEVMPIVANFGYGPIRFFPFSFDAIPPSNFGFGWCNIARIGLASNPTR